MNNVLIGHSGFVGSNIKNSTNFDAVFNSKNIGKAYGLNPDLLVYSGVPAQKFVANQNPEADYQTILTAIDNIKKINPKKVVLISTIDVYKEPINVDEDSTMITDGLHPYGLNRLKLEQWVEENCADYLIVRLPALFGINLKKNFIYDLLNPIPSMLNEAKFTELSSESDLIAKSYVKQDNGFYTCVNKSKELENVFNDLNFTSLKFTDSRAVFQFYNLARLWNDINLFVDNGIKKANLVTEPISANDIYQYLYSKPFINEVNDNFPVYKLNTKHSDLFNNGTDKYMLSSKQILEEIKTFVERANNDETSNI